MFALLPELRLFPSPAFLEMTRRFGFPVSAVVLAAVVCGACESTFTLPGEDDPAAFFGPLPYRSMMPHSLIFPHPIPDKASTLDGGSTEVTWHTAYASVFTENDRGSERFKVDGEFLRTSVVAKHGICERLEAAVEIPFVHYTSGFLDHTIEEYHDLFGFPQGGRDKNPNDQYATIYENERGGFFRAKEDGFHIADIPLYLKVGILDPVEDDLGLAARGVVELPTGNENSGFGSGKVDTGVGVLAQKFLGSYAGYVNLDYVFRRSPNSFRGGVRAKNVTHASLAVEKAFTDVFSLVVQTDYQTRPFDGVDLSEWEDPEWAITFGANFRVAELVKMRIYFSEGLTTDSAPDFTVGLVLGTEF